MVGGTFDPIHLGHVSLALAARDCAGLDSVLLMPVSVPPHRGAPSASARDRLEMCRLAAEGLRAVEVSDLELRRAGPSYTVDTMRALHRERPGDDLWLVLGWDAARDLHLWREPDQILSLARLVIVNRPGLEAPRPGDLLTAGIDPVRAVVCHARTPDIVATDVRRRLEHGGPLDGLVAPAVADFIRARGLYRGDNAG